MSEPTSWENVPMFDPGPSSPKWQRPKSIEQPVWSENKADLIARYLRYFVFITYHGTYIDAFAGPQTSRSERAWTARLVLESEPKRLRHFHLFDKSPRQAQWLVGLRAEHPERDVEVHEGDSNLLLPAVLPEGSIREREATFCLLDQRTFECRWSLCEHIARLRPGAFKVEQFYFLANSWMPRAIAAVKTEATAQRVEAWLGGPDWQQFGRSSPLDRVHVFVEKFKSELGYRSVEPWPIFQRARGTGATMYWMIHATDHEEAPKLMARAYGRAVDPPEEPDQLALDLRGITIDEDISTE